MPRKVTAWVHSKEEENLKCMHLNMHRWSYTPLKSLSELLGGTLPDIAAIECSPLECDVIIAILSTSGLHAEH